MLRFNTKALLCLYVFLSPVAAQEQGPQVDPGALAFEQGRWAEAIDAYGRVLNEDPGNGLAMLRIAQAQRELDRHTRALETLQVAREAGAPPAMVELERARNLAALGQRDSALRALEAADHEGLRALEMLDEAEELRALRSAEPFQRVYRSVRQRVFPCEAMPASREFDFWLGRWEVRLADGTLIGQNHITKESGGCGIVERWQGAGGSSGNSVTYFMPSAGLWRQIWVGSTGTLIDMTGGRADDGSMHLEGTIEYVSPERVVAFRGTWMQLADGQVRQLLEEFDLASQSWQVWFDGYYRHHPGGAGQ